MEASIIKQRQSAYNMNDASTLLSATGVVLPSEPDFDFGAPTIIGQQWRWTKCCLSTHRILHSIVFSLLPTNGRPNIVSVPGPSFQI